LQARTILNTAVGLAALSAALILLTALAPPNALGAYGAKSAAALAVVAAALAAACLWYANRSARNTATDIQLFARILDSADGARVVTDQSGRVLYRNGSGRDWLSSVAPLEYLSSRVISDLDVDDSVGRLRQAAASGLPLRVEVPISGSAGEPDWLLVSVRPIEFEQTLMLWSAEDVSAQRTINEILGQERQDLADFLYFLPTGLYSVDVDGTFKFANQRFASWLGYEAEEVVGLTLDDVMVGTNRPQPDGEWQGEVQFRTRSGDVFPSLALQSTFDDAGETRTRTLVIRDGMRREQEAAPGRVAYERFRALFDAAPMAIAITDPEGVVVDCNNAFEGLSGQSRAALIGGTLTEKIIADDQNAFGKELSKVLSGEEEGAHLDVRVAGEAVAQTSVFIGPLSAPGLEPEDIEGAVAHFIDVTEQKSLEAQFAQAQKMQAMGQLAGGVAHEFNNLLTAMIGFCDLLLHRHAAGDPSFADIMQIKQNANRAANLVRQLLAFSRKQPLQPKELNVTDALMELSHLLTRLIGEAIEFKLVHGRDLGVVKVDPGQFDQMIINLAVNARDAMSGGGKLTITTGTETFDQPTQVGPEQAPPGRYVRIAVADSGKGIAPENLGRIFEPFFSTKKEIPGAGTGLGLATVYGIVRQTGGFILVDSAPGRGATFNIYLPRIGSYADESENAAADLIASAHDAKTRSQQVPRQAPEEEADVAAAELGGTGTVLLVEDEDAVRVFAARALKNKGYKVLQARTGEQALEILHDSPNVDLMITDMMMPGMDGGTLARLIRVERPEIRIIVISGYSEEVARGDIVDTEDFHFLPKPFSLGQLASKVKEVLTA